MKFSLPLLAAAAVAAVWATPAQAAFVTPTTTVTNGDFEVRYAVYQTEGGTFESELGVDSSVVAGGGTIQSSSPFVYLYQVFNNSATRRAASFAIDLIGPGFTSAGFLTDSSGLTDDGFVEGTIAPDFFDQGTAAEFLFSGFAPNSVSEVFFGTSPGAPALTIASLDVSGQTADLVFGVEAPSAVPEPASMALFALFGVAGGGATWRRKKKADAAV